MAVPGKWFPPSSVAQPRGPDDRRPCRDGRRPRGPCEACDLVRAERTPRPQYLRI